MKIEDYHIDQFVIGKLAGTALVEFQKQLETDENLQALVVERSRIVAGLDLLHEQQLRSQFAKFEKMRMTDEEVEAVVVNIKPRRSWLSVAAVVLAVLASVFVLRNLLSDSSSPKELAQAALQNSAPNLAITEGMFRGQGTNSNSTTPTDTEEVMKKVHELFLDKDYSTALQILETLPQDTLMTYQSAAYFRYGILELYLGNYESAVEKLNLVTDNKSDWYKALAMLQIEGRAEDGKAILKRISDSSKPHPFKADAKDLLENLTH